MSSKFNYLATSMMRKLKGAAVVCPSCSHPQSDLVARKYLVTELRRCGLCSLLFRAPTFSPDESAAFYEDEYSVGFTTDLPSEQALRELLVNRFRGTEKDYSVYLAVLAALGVPSAARVFDFGCSWGYGSWQLRDYGFQVESFEISRRRAEYARDKLNLTVFDRLPSPDHSYDVFFSAHVLEHVPSVARSIVYGLATLKPGGLFVAFTPNASNEFRRRMPGDWMKAWGLVHPNFLDDDYYRRAWARQPYLISSPPYPLDQLHQWSTDRQGALTCQLAGDELLSVSVAP